MSRLRSAVLICALAITSLASGQTNGLLLLGVGKSGAAAAPSFAFLDGSAKNLGVNGGTSDPVDSTGGTIIIIAVSGFADAPVVAGDISDSESQTWTECGTGYQRPSDTRIQTFAAELSSTDANHTVTVTKTASFASIVVAVFSGGGQSPCDDEDGDAVNASSISPATGITTSVAALVISSLGFGAVGGTLTTPTGYTSVGTVTTVGGSAYGVAMAYKIQVAAGAEDPEWSTDAGANAMATQVASYVP